MISDWKLPLPLETGQEEEEEEEETEEEEEETEEEKDPRRVILHCKLAGDWIWSCSDRSRVPP